MALLPVFASFGGFSKVCQNNKLLRICYAEALLLVFLSFRGDRTFVAIDISRLDQESVVGSL